MNTTTEPPHPAGGDVALTYVLLPFFIITITGIIVAAVGAITKAGFIIIQHIVKHLSLL